MRLLEGTEIRARPSQEIKDLRTEIHHIGNNINQIARSVNAGIAKAEDARRGLYLLDQVYELMYQIVKKQAVSISFRAIVCYSNCFYSLSAKNATAIAPGPAWVLIVLPIIVTGREFKCSCQSVRLLSI